VPSSNSPRPDSITEVAPGIDVETDVIDEMGFEPLVADDLDEMDSRLFVDERFDLTDVLYSNN